MTEPGRYQRQIQLPEIGEAGQKRFGEACVAIVGVGALGGNAAQMLCRMGIGELILIDDDVLQLHNLHRQVLYNEDDVQGGNPKVVSAQKHLHRINGDCRVRAHSVRLTAENIDELLADAEVIVDGTDNFTARFLLNDYSVKNNKPFIHGAVLAMSGTMMVVRPGGRPCLACLYPETPDNDEVETVETAGVLACAPAVIAQWQVTEVCKFLVNQPTLPNMILHDIWRGETLLNNVPPDPDCRCCGRRDFIYLH